MEDNPIKSATGPKPDEDVRVPTKQREVLFVGFVPSYSRNTDKLRGETSISDLRIAATSRIKSYLEDQHYHSNNKDRRMHTVWVRLNAVVFFGLTVLLGLSCLAAFSKIGHSYIHQPGKI